jgi:hypothetical protein
VVFTYLGVLPVWERVTLDIFSRPMGLQALQSVSMGMLKPQPERKRSSEQQQQQHGGGDVDSWSTAAKRR